MTAPDDGAAPLRPILTTDPLLRNRGLAVAWGPHHFAEVAVRSEGRAAVFPAAAVAALHPQHAPLLARIAASRGALGALPLDRPRVLAVLDLDPDGASVETVADRVDALAREGAEAVELRPPAEAAAGWAARLARIGDRLPLVLAVPDARLAAAAGAVAFRPDRPEPRPAGSLRAVIALPAGEVGFTAASRRLDAFAPDQAARARAIVEVSPDAPSCLGRLPELHGLGVALMLDLTGAALTRSGPSAAAAAAVLGAGFGVQILRTTSVAAVSGALALWRAANGLGP